MSTMALPDYPNLLSDLGCNLAGRTASGYHYLRPGDDSCVLIDVGICELSHYAYIDYTAQQNELMHRHRRLFRFLFVPAAETEKELLAEVAFFLDGDEEPETLKLFGRNRSEHEIDPSRPEATFEDAFITAFGDRHREALHREYQYFDREGHRRFLDYALFTRREKFAIELNGESFHHPAVIGPARYRSQLCKQNSLVADGFKVFRWSLRGMSDPDRFTRDLQRFFGNPEEFKARSLVRGDRPLATLDLHEHQVDALAYLTRERARGRSNFLIVLPTGTGKTEIFIKDIASFLEKRADFSALILVPSRKLKEQTLERCRLRLPEFAERIGPEIRETGITVQTYAYLQRHFHELDPGHYDYIVVDEAHHSAAVGLRRCLEHFTPEHLLGVTATPERFDQRKLEEIFGEYESPLSLEEAISKGVVPPVRCFRIRSNIDLSEVRFNGRDFVKSDLQTSLQVPSRDWLIVETLQKYFGGRLADKQGVVFGVDIAHTRRLARALTEAGIPALAVDGRDRARAEAAQREYDSGKVRFLCACNLLTEGWDAPRTQILVMARPTFSKVLYTQQLGRGLRHFPGKEALYVLDVVDNYGARLAAPMSLHGLLGIAEYLPFADLVKPERGGREDEVVILDGLYESVRRIEPVDILTYSEKYGDHLNEEQLARELFVSTGTVKSWIKKGRITPDHTIPFGRSRLHFFAPERVEEIRRRQNLSRHTEETRKKDFLDFLEKRDYTFSYKIIFLLAFLKLKNARGEADLSALLELYRQFYQRLLQHRQRCEKPNCPYNRSEVLADIAGLQRSLLQNPFEKFERKRFFHHCKDLNYIAIDPVLQRQLEAKELAAIRRQMREDLEKYYARLEIEIEPGDYDFLLPSADEETPPLPLPLVENPPEEERYTRLLPLYPLEIAAGGFQDSPLPAEPDGWVEMAKVSSRQSFDDSMFIARINGKSMEPRIPDGSFCLFTRNVGGSRQGRVVLARHDGRTDPETSAAFTIKRYYSEKKADPESEWVHEKIILKPENPAFAPLEIPAEEAAAGAFAIVAFLVDVLELETREIQ